MARTRLPPHDIADLGLATSGVSRIAWAGEQMPVLARIRERFSETRPLDGIRVGACLHVTAETAQLVAAAVQAALQAGTPSRPPRRGRRVPAGCQQLF